MKYKVRVREEEVVPSLGGDLWYETDILPFLDDGMVKITDCNLVKSVTVVSSNFMKETTESILRIYKELSFNVNRIISYSIEEKVD
ncbi:MAG: hypothetical protein GY804_11915 [Alphaproteobacteria bacterium]|nr:hypothetical protein [Alphaproteobacteria bacterium]